MKRLFFTILCATIALASSAQKPSANSTMVFDSSQWDFGTIKEADGPVTHLFKFINTGKTPFVIEAISVSCGCTTPDYPRAPIMPGQSAEIKITFDPDLRPGKFVKEIYVVSNNRKNVNTLKIRGNVVAKPRTVADDYPLELTSGVRLTAQMTNFSYIAQGQTRSQVIGVANTSSRTVDLQVRPEEQSPYFSVSVPAKVCAGCVADITFTYDLSKGTYWGYMSDESYLYIDGKKMPVPLSSSAIGVDDFSRVDRAEAPRAIFSRINQNIGIVKVGSKASCEFTITNDGRSPLVVRSAKSANGTTTTLREGVTIAPDSSVTFTVAKDARMVGSLSGAVVIITNDPAHAMREVRFVATVQQ